MTPTTLQQSKLDFSLEKWRFQLNCILGSVRYWLWGWLFFLLRPFYKRGMMVNGRPGNFGCRSVREGGVIIVAGCVIVCLYISVLTRNEIEKNMEFFDSQFLCWLKMRFRVNFRFYGSVSRFYIIAMMFVLFVMRNDCFLRFLFLVKWSSCVSENVDGWMSDEVMCGSGQCKK